MGKEVTRCYVKDAEFAWVPATLDKQEGDKAHVTIQEYATEQAITSDGGRGAKKETSKVINLKDYAHKVLPLQNVDNNGMLMQHADMVKLPYLHEAGILYNMVRSSCRCFICLVCEAFIGVLLACLLVHLLYIHPEINMYQRTDECFLFMLLLTLL